MRSLSGTLSVSRVDFARHAAEAVLMDLGFGGAASQWDVDGNELCCW